MVICLVHFAELFSVGRWTSLFDSAQDSSLLKLAESLPNYCLKSKAENTVKKYRYAFKNFSKWCKTFKPTIDHLPASDVHVALYLAYLANTFDSSSKIEEATHAITWAHDMAGFPNPCDSTFVKFVKEGCIREHSHPVVKKEPISSDILSAVVEKFGKSDATLYDLRTCCIFLLGYAGFLRFSEIVNIRRSQLVFSDSHLTLFITKSKTDVYKQGSSLCISKTNSSTCPVSMLLRYLLLSDIDERSEDFIFRQVTFCKKNNSYKLRNNKQPLSYTRVRELVLSTLDSLGLDSKKYGVHSLRSGGATAAAAAGVSDRLFKKHGRWKSENAKDGYVHENLQVKLSVTKQLGL